MLARWFIFSLLVLVVLAPANAATTAPPSAVAAFAGSPHNQNPKVTRMKGSRISLLGKEHQGYLNWLVVRIPGTNEARSVLLDDPERGKGERLSESELKELDAWFRKSGSEWSGSYADKSLFRRLVLPHWGDLDRHEEWQKGYIRFQPTPDVWAVTCDHPSAKDVGPGKRVTGSTTYFDAEGNRLCTVVHSLYVD